MMGEEDESAWVLEMQTESIKRKQGDVSERAQAALDSRVPRCQHRLRRDRRRKAAEAVTTQARCAIANSTGN